MVVQQTKHCGETLHKGKQERHRAHLMRCLEGKKMTQKQVADELGICTRQVRRLWRHWKQYGSVSSVLVTGNPAHAKNLASISHACAVLAAGNWFRWMEKRNQPFSVPAVSSRDAHRPSKMSDSELELILAVQTQRKVDKNHLFSYGGNATQ